jgi:class 3 adenylate cyclase
MEPRIQYAKTADGVSIAFWTLGEGAPFVLMPWIPWSHIQVEWQIPACRRWSERLAEKRKLVRYDGRGTGLSDRNVADYSFDAHVLDLQAVVERLGVQRFVLTGPVSAAPVAIAYAARYPKAVSQLVLWCPWWWSRERRAQALWALSKGGDWELYTEAVAYASLGWSAGEEAHRYAAYLRECTTLEAARAIFRALAEFDVMAELSQVRSLTLIVQRRQVTAVPGLEFAKGLTSGMWDARLALLEGEALFWWVGDVEAVLAAIDEFLGEGDKATEAAAGPLPEGMAVILFTDIADSTALTEQLGDSAFRAKAKELDTSLRSVIREAGGTPVEGKVLGDGVMAVFTSARQAIECALHCNVAAQDTGLSLHLGIHAGDVIREGNTVYGGAVNIAARIAGASAPGELLVSDTVRSLARTSANVVFENRGEQALKGVGEPQRLFAVRGEAT